ncbi:MAG: DUF1634 domain-containing protein [Planctomycetota bacterium]
MDAAKEAKVSLINLRLASLMIAGVWLAAGLCMLGLAMSLIQGEPRATLKPFTGVMGELTSPTAVLSAAVKLDPRGLMALGVLVLIATPVARVAFSLVTFAMERDKVYVLITAIVLGLLGVGLFAGIGHV